MLEIDFSSKREKGSWRFCPHRPTSTIVYCPKCGAGNYICNDVFADNGESKEELWCVNSNCDFLQFVKLIHWMP